MLWILFAAVVLIALLLFVRIEAEIKTIRRKRSFYVVKIRFLGIKVYGGTFFLRFGGGNIKLLKVKKCGYTHVGDFVSEVRKVRKIKKEGKEVPKLGFIAKALKVKEGGAAFSLGTGNAASTALYCGAIAGAARATLAAYDLKLEIEANPNFYERCFIFNADCIFSTTAAQIIYCYIKQKGGK